MRGGECKYEFKRVEQLDSRAGGEMLVQMDNLPDFGGPLAGLAEAEPVAGLASTGQPGLGAVLPAAGWRLAPVAVVVVAAGLMEPCSVWPPP